MNDKPNSANFLQTVSTMPLQTPPTKLFRKLFNIMKAVESVKKSGLNKHQNYQYTTEADLVEAVRGALIENEVLVLTSSDTKEVHKIASKDKESIMTVVNTIHTFIDVESGEQYEVRSTGTGHDATDKGVFKAITGAMKYFLSKNFMIASQDDPENDSANPSYVRGGEGGAKPASRFSRSAAPTTSASKAEAAPTTTVATKPVTNTAVSTPAPVATKPATATAAPARKSFSSMNKDTTVKPPSGRPAFGSAAKPAATAQPKAEPEFELEPESEAL